jgi:hypothetical protein
MLEHQHCSLLSHQQIRNGLNDMISLEQTLVEKQERKTKE